MLHQQLVESVCDKAQQLVDQTQDKSLNIYLQSIKQLYQNIVTKSQVCEWVMDYVWIIPRGYMYKNTNIFLITWYFSVIYLC